MPMALYDKTSTEFTQTMTMALYDKTSTEFEAKTMIFQWEYARNQYRIRKSKTMIFRHGCTPRPGPWRVHHGRRAAGAVVHPRLRGARAEILAHALILGPPAEISAEISDS